MSASWCEMFVLKLSGIDTKFISSPETGNRNIQRFDIRIRRIFIDLLNFVERTKHYIFLLKQ